MGSTSFQAPSSVRCYLHIASTIKAVQSMKFVSACVLTLALFATLGDALPLLPAARDANQKKPRLPAEQAFKAANHTLLGGPDFKALSKTVASFPPLSVSNQCWVNYCNNAHGSTTSVNDLREYAGCDAECTVTAKIVAKCKGHYMTFGKTEISKKTRIVPATSNPLTNCAPDVWQAALCSTAEHQYGPHYGPPGMDGGIGAYSRSYIFHGEDCETPCQNTLNQLHQNNVMQLQWNLGCCYWIPKDKTCFLSTDPNAKIIEGSHGSMAKIVIRRI